LQVVLRLADDADLVRRLKARDPKAMSDLYDRYGRLAYSLIHRVVRNASAAEDLLQETFMRVWNRVGSFDAERGALGPWVLAVARNRAIDYLRSVDGRMQAAAVDLDRIEHPAQFSGIESSRAAEAATGHREDLDPERAQDSARRAESGARIGEAAFPTSTDLAPRF
jgi:RNA polymerase sigma factor (sigma-70 family)